MNLFCFQLEPVAKPRQTRADVWKKRPTVLRYRAFADELRLKANRQRFVMPESGAAITFAIQMPASWSEKKRLAMSGKPHQSKPDLDNLYKAMLDALLEDDSRVHQVTLRKVWSRTPYIEVQVS